MMKYANFSVQKEIKYIIDLHHWTSRINEFLLYILLIDSEQPYRSLIWYTHRINSNRCRTKYWVHHMYWSNQLWNVNVRLVACKNLLPTPGGKYMRHLDNKKKQMKYLSIRSEWESIYSGFCVRRNLYCSAIIFYFLIVVTILRNFLQALTCRFFLSYKIASQKWYICCRGAHKG